MRLSEFRQALSDEFGDGYGRVLTRDLILTPFGCTAPPALAGGASAPEVGFAHSPQKEVPHAPRYR
ncbi:MAG: DUF3046 domain-containing protein, partial [Cryobacterium sp.]|nr:DUF3046 domain-containing protein [Cryobacterium sp.]